MLYTDIQFREQMIISVADLFIKKIVKEALLLQGKCESY